MQVIPTAAASALLQTRNGKLGQLVAEFSLLTIVISPPSLFYTTIISKLEVGSSTPFMPSRASDGDDPMKPFLRQKYWQRLVDPCRLLTDLLPLLKNCGIRRRVVHVKLHVSVADAHKDRAICSLTLRCRTFSAEA
jgi:hypothetical protein